MAFVVQRTSLIPLRVDVSHATTGVVIPAAGHRLLVDAQRIIAHATAQAEAITGQSQQAYEAACARGYKEGAERARLEQAERMIENVARTIDYFSRVEADAIALVMTSVRKIIQEFSDEQKVGIVVRSALAAVRNQKQITLRLHPDDAMPAKGRLNELLSGFPAIGFVDIVADGRIAPCACIVETDIGLVETSLDGQMSALESAFRKVLGDDGGLLSPVSSLAREARPRPVAVANVEYLPSVAEARGRGGAGDHGMGDTQALEQGS